MKKKLKTLLTTLSALVLAVVMVFAVAACGDKTPPEEGPNNPNPPIVTPGGDEKETITVTGVENGKTYPYGSEVKPAFDKGTATLKRGNGAAEAFTSGTAVTKVGSYTLAVTHDKADTVTVKFSIALPDTTGQITDEFIDDVPASDYFTDSAVSFSGGNMTVSHPADSQAWGISRRKIEHVNVTEWPYIEVRVDSVKNCTPALVVRLSETSAGADNLSSEFDLPGLYYVDVKTFAETKGWNLTDQDVYVELNIVGSANIDMEATFDYYKSAKAVAPLAPCDVRYVDNTPETVNTWKANTANIQWFEGDDSATAIITGNEGYGKFSKRLNLNTEEWPFIIVDVEDVVSSYAIKAVLYENYQKQKKEIDILGTTTKAGKQEINLQKFFGVSKNVDVLFDFYITGKSEEKTFRLKGLEQTDQPLTDIKLGGTQDGATVNSAEAGAKVTFDKGTATIQKDGGEAVAYTSGTEVTEVGSYVVTVKAGTFEHTVSFIVVRQVVINTSGIADGDSINIGWKDAPALTFDKGTATIKKGDGEATAYTSGTEITEAGSYVITVSAPDAMTKTFAFAVYDRTVPTGTFEDYCTLNTHVIQENNAARLPNAQYNDYQKDFAIMYDAAQMAWNPDTGNLEFTKIAQQQYSELIKTYTLTLPENGYFELVFKPLNNYNPDSGFKFQVNGQETAYPQAVSKDVKDGIHTVRYNIPAALKGKADQAVTVIIKIQYGDGVKAISLHSLRVIEEILIGGTANNATVNAAVEPAKVTFNKGTATVKKDDGEATAYTSGTEITEAGSYVVTITWGDVVKTVSFTVVNVNINAQGIKDGDYIRLGNVDTVALTFDRGTATIQKGSAEATAYTSGTAVTEVGKYVIAITESGYTETIRFTVVDETTFLDYTTATGYTTAGNMEVKQTETGLQYTSVAAGNKLTMPNMTLNFEEDYQYFVVSVKPVDGYSFGSGGFNIEVQQQLAIWHNFGRTYDKKAKEVVDEQGVHHIYWKIEKPDNLAGGEQVTWTGEESSLHVSVGMNGTGTVELRAFSFAKELPSV